MDIQSTLKGVRDVFTVKRVYGDPYEKDGITIIPAASVGGGGGGGGGEGPPGQGGGSGAGFGIGARPAGAFIIENGTVRWQPAVDPNRVLALAVVGLLVLRSIVKTRARTKRTKAKAS
jgi:uncharacterized spore protein YtfJ